MSTREIDPYTKVWNSVEDHEGDLLEMVKNGTMFVPTWEVMGHRYVSRSKFLLALARKQESRAAGRKLFTDALFYRDLAARAFEEHQRVLAYSR